jgi:hypothetical protein
MGSILKKAARGFAQAGVSIADGALAELRQRRLMELQQGFAREDREINRADRKEERQQEMDMRAQERQQDMQYRQQRDASEDAYRQQTLEKSDRQFNTSMDFNKDNEEFDRVSAAYSGALAGVASLNSRIAEIKSMKPKINSNGEPIEDPAAFEDNRLTMLKDAEEELAIEQAKARQKVDALDKQFPQFRKYAPKIQSAPPLLSKTPLQLQ